ncbi:unnamed protein product [Dibothriocephalus latus]|uniref:Condensin complex subunit 1 C-terminal domain-containing protein n=1 Tax=Dibothriocephalus latus TaxID=60516 RepID=A0A3P7NVG8_DIBLA|nr:unnamed protein product [Dibothriocephalus latus]
MDSSPMIAIFEECQETSLSHDRLCSALMNLYQQMPFSHFTEEFFELCRYSLVSAERSPYRERTVDFIVRFVMQASKNSDSAFDENSTKNQLLIKTFLFCAKHTVRIQSIHGLCRLQDPTNKDCPVVANLLWLARHDIPEVRRTALAALVLTTVTLPCVVERCRDVSDAVRKTAYGILAERSVLRPLSIAKRIAIIQDGLKDTSQEVRKAAEELVLAWFKAVDQDPILLLRRLDTEGVPQTSRLCLERLLQNLDVETLMSVFKKWSEEYLDESRVNDLLELLQADLDYNENIMEAECVLEHVFHFCDSLDLSDEFGRRRLYTVVRNWLVNQNVPASLTAFLLKLYFNIETNVINDSAIYTEY